MRRFTRIAETLRGIVLFIPVVLLSRSKLWEPKGSEGGTMLWSLTASSELKGIFGLRFAPYV